MKIPDPLILKSQPSRGTIIFAGSRLLDDARPQEDCFMHFNDECFVVADGVSGGHGKIAATLASETAVWGYKHVRQRPFYWADKRLLLKRIFRSSNLAVWQKKRETGFESGLATTLSVAIVGPNKVWVGSVGDSAMLLYRDGLIDVLTKSDTDELHRLTRALGFKRLGLLPHLKVEVFLPGDMLILATSGVTQFVAEDEIRTVCEATGDTTESIGNAVSHLLQTAKENGSKKNLTLCMIKRLNRQE
jgi:serine/threonine protein phosphatase PrpC